jgi:hypothetical protein
VPLDDGGRLDQHHRVHTARPQAVEPDPEQAVDRKQPKPTRPLAAQHVKLMTESKVLEFQKPPGYGIGGQEPRLWNAHA